MADRRNQQRRIGGSGGGSTAYKEAGEGLSELWENRKVVGAVVATAAGGTALALDPQLAIATAVTATIVVGGAKLARERRKASAAAELKEKASVQTSKRKQTVKAKREERQEILDAPARKKRPPSPTGQSGAQPINRPAPEEQRPLPEPPRVKPVAPGFSDDQGDVPRRRRQPPTLSADTNPPAPATVSSPESARPRLQTHDTLTPAEIKKIEALVSELRQRETVAVNAQSPSPDPTGPDPRPNAADQTQLFTQQWTEARVESELTVFLAAREAKGLFDWPKRREFDESGNGPLYRAINRFGGQDVWPAKFGREKRLPQSVLMRQAAEARKADEAS
jgi:hypothetical protein